MTVSTEILDHPHAIAIIGMAGRFPGARSIDEFRRNLEKGIESITVLSQQELLANGVPQEQLDDPNYVKAAALLEGYDLFDASFFQYAAREAEMIDPQHRIFLECAWETLESAGYANQPEEHVIGVFAGAGGVMSSYLLSNLHINDKIIGYSASREHIGNDKDYLSTRVSYKLNLRGPSLSVQTACSSSLVAVHLACQSLLSGECDMALAGGISLRIPQHVGYLYQEGAILSPDGHCRPFDAKGQGTIFGSGVGIVALKLLEDAIRDGDSIDAVIRGSAINNDGAQKVSYWATSAEGQATAIKQALAVAGVDPDTIGYVEAHGTATSQGDAAEIFALQRVFQSKKRQSCAIGSAESNVGHLDAASGITGLIKTVLALKHKTLYPTLHFSTPNPIMHIEDTPFYVNTDLKEWMAPSHPRRAAVNSLGVGGTNAHLILEEAPEFPSPTIDIERPYHLLTLSAKTPQALQDMAIRFAEHLGQQSTQSFADVCYSANIGRAHFNHRLALVAATTAEAVAQLNTFNERASTIQPCLFDPSRTLRIAFLFTGQGAQYVDMGRELYETQPCFRKIIDRCDEILRPYLEHPLRSVMYPASQPGETESADKLNADLLNAAPYTQLALFALEYALAQLWQSWGIQPDILIGRDVGEIGAACVAGVFSLEDALKLVATRGWPISYHKPTLPLVSSLTGQLAGEEICTPDYWGDHVSAAERFADGVKTLQKQSIDIFLELGPRSTLLGMAREILDRANDDSSHVVMLSSLCENQNDWKQMLASLGTLYVSGVDVDWQDLDRDYPRRKVRLPTYPFQRQRYWAEPTYMNRATPATDFAHWLAMQNIEQVAEWMVAQEGFSALERQTVIKTLTTLKAQSCTHEIATQSIPNPRKLFNWQREGKSLQAALVREVEELPVNHRLAYLNNRLQEEVKDVLAMTDVPDTSMKFVTLGMDSLKAVELRNRLQNLIGVQFAPTALYEFSTIQHLANHLMTDILPAMAASRKLIAEGAKYSDHREVQPGEYDATTPLVPIQPEGSKLPFFCVHPLLGTVYSYNQLAALLGREQPVYGLQIVERNKRFVIGIEQMAGIYIAALRTVQPHGPYFLGGWSFGAVVAFEMARQLEQAGEPIAFLAVFDQRIPPEYLLGRVWALLQIFANIIMPYGGYFIREHVRWSELEYCHKASQPLHRVWTIVTLIRMVWANLASFLTYQPQTYGGRIHLFQTATSRQRSNGDLDWGWGKWAQGSVEWIEIPGCHVNLVKDPHVTVLAEKLRNVLRQTQKSVEMRN